MVEADETAWLTEPAQFIEEQTASVWVADAIHRAEVEEESTAAAWACVTPTVCAASMPETKLSAR